MDRGLIISIVLFSGLLVGYIVLSIMNVYGADLCGELLKYVTIAIVSCYLGRASGARDIGIGHITKAYCIRAGLIGLGFGTALILSHAVLFGIDPIWKDPLGHEAIGLYIVIASMVAMGWAKEDCPHDCPVGSNVSPDDPKGADDPVILDMMQRISRLEADVAWLKKMESANMFITVSTFLTLIVMLISILR